MNYYRPLSIAQFLQERCNRPDSTPLQQVKKAVLYNHRTEEELPES